MIWKIISYTVFNPRIAILINSVLLLFLIIPNCYGQDQSFSQFSTNTLYYNPGYVGNNDKIDILGHYRRYLTKIPSKFESIFFSVDYPFNRGKSFGLGGLGILIFKNTEGDGKLGTTMISVPFSTQISNTKYRSKHSVIVQFGIMPSIVFKTINSNNYIFGNQLNKYYGYVDSIASPLSNGTENRLTYYDFSFGFFGKFIDDPSKQSNVITKVWEFGIAFHHFLWDINQSFTNGDAPLPGKIVALVKYTFPLDKFRYKHILLQPAFIYEKQGQMNTLQINSTIFNDNLLFGIGLRKEQREVISFNNFTLEGGFSLKNFNNEGKRLWVILSIDLPIKSQYTLVNSSYEISINFKTPVRSKGVCRNFER